MPSGPCVFFFWLLNIEYCARLLLVAGILSGGKEVGLVISIWGRWGVLIGRISNELSMPDSSVLSPRLGVYRITRDGDLGSAGYELFLSEDIIGSGTSFI